MAGPDILAPLEETARSLLPGFTLPSLDGSIPPGGAPASGGSHAAIPGATIRLSTWAAVVAAAPKHRLALHSLGATHARARRPGGKAGGAALTDGTAAAVERGAARRECARVSIRNDGLQCTGPGEWWESQRTSQQMIVVIVVPAGVVAEKLATDVAGSQMPVARESVGGCWCRGRAHGSTEARPAGRAGCARYGC